MTHTPVLLDAVLKAVKPFSDGSYIDATVGEGGHAFVLLNTSQPNGRLLGLDQDERQIEVARQRLAPFAKRSTLVCSRYSNIGQVATDTGFTYVDAILFDLGVSNRQLTDKPFGLSIADDTPLDMRLSHGCRYSAADFLNHAQEREIADILYRYGDRHNSRMLAGKIMAFRRRQPFQTAYDLKEALNMWMPGQLAPIFQALRIYVNDEFDQLREALPQAIHLLKPGGKLLVISFHSGEDRIVKQFLREHKTIFGKLQPVIQPSMAEMQANPRSRSAKLRIAAKEIHSL